MKQHKKLKKRRHGQGRTRKPVKSQPFQFQEAALVQRAASARASGYGEQRGGWRFDTKLGTSPRPRRTVDNGDW